MRKVIVNEWMSLEPLEWQNSTLLQGDVAVAVAVLKQEDGDDLHVIGTKLVQALIEHDLVDEFPVTIDPDRR